MPDADSPASRPTPVPLLIVGDPDAVACVGDSCDVPAREVPAASNRLPDGESG